MRKLFLFFISLFFFFSFSVLKSSAVEINSQTDLEKKTLEMINNSVVGEQIKNFNTDIKIQKDGSIEVKETISYYFDTYRHGIYRNIPFTIYDKDKRYDMQYKFEDVRDAQGKKYTTSQSKSGERWVLKIGDPNKTISGDHTYVITYLVKGALGYFKDHDELYWNSTGTEWTVPIKKASTTITLPQKIDASAIKLLCYTGARSSTKQRCTTTTDGLSSQFTTTLFLNANEGITVIKSFPKGIAAELKPVKYIPFFDRWYGKITLLGIILVGIFWYIIMPIYLVLKWHKYGRDPEVGIALTADFDPPKLGKRFLTPAETGALIDEHVQQRDIFASIVDLARRGYIKIEEREKKDFYLVFLIKSKNPDKIQPFEEELLTGIFAGVTEIRIKDTKMYTTIGSVSTLLYNDLVTHGYFKKNPRTTRNLYYALGGIALFTSNLVLAFVAFLFGRHMPAKTLLGALTSQKAKGLKNFLDSQERQLNFQGDRQMLFERLLPYAIAFGVEKAWAKRFEKFDLKQPGWYSGYGSNTFSSIYLASALSNSYSSFSVASTPPSSSGSGFSGGSSGGGGGGGGGGSW